MAACRRGHGSTEAGAVVDGTSASSRQPVLPCRYSYPKTARISSEDALQREPVDSSVIASMGYALATRILELEFRETSEIYDYFDVPPEEYAAFRGAESKGTYLNHVFKLRGYRYIRVTDSKLLDSFSSS